MKTLAILLLNLKMITQIGGSGGGGCGAGAGRFQALLLAAAADRNVAKSATFGPVPFTSLAKMARLSLVVVVVVAKLGVCRAASRASQRLRLRLCLPPRRIRLRQLQAAGPEKALSPVNPIARNLFITQTHLRNQAKKLIHSKKI